MGCQKYGPKVWSEIAVLSLAVRRLVQTSYWGTDMSGVSVTHTKNMGFGRVQGQVLHIKYIRLIILILNYPCNYHGR